MCPRPRAGSIRGVIGAILAGGRGRRMGGDKPGRELGGRPLIAWPADALAEGLAAAAVADGVLQPVFAAYSPAALAAFREAPPDAALTRTVDAMRPALVEV